MTPLLNGRRAGRPSRASMNARSMYCMVGAISTEPVWCSCRFVPGSAVKSGSSASARLILTTPLRVFQCSMSVTKSSGRFCAADVVQERGARVQRGDDDLAVISWPFSRTTPAARPFVEQDPGDPGAGPDLGAELAGGAGDRVGDRAHAALGKPQLPRWPSPTSPIEWWAITYAVPGSYGPAQVPITPLTASAPLTCGDSNQSSSRSAIDIVISRVTSAIVRTSSLRWRQASRSVCCEVTGLARAEVRRHGEQQRAEHVGQPGQPGVPARHRVGVLLRPAGDLVVVALGVVGVQLDRPALGEGLVVRAHREDL